MGIADNHGTNVKTGFDLNREILKTGWRPVMQMLGYKYMELIGLNPAYSSQLCNACGYVDPENRNDRKFECVTRRQPIDISPCARQSSGWEEVEM